MIALLAVLLSGSIVLGVTFAALFGKPWKHREPRGAWLLTVWTYVAVALDLLLLAVVLRIHIPLWLPVVVLSAQDAVVGFRLWLLLRERRR